VSNQSKLVSAVEVTLNVGSGFVTAFLVWQLIANPLFGYEVTYAQNFVLTSIFTGVSLVRGYLWRRFFARGLHVTVANWIGRVT
jgi:hypothetical protein